MKYILIFPIGGSQYESTCYQYVFGPYTKEEVKIEFDKVSSLIENSEFSDYWIPHIFDTENKVDSIDNFIEFELTI